MKNSLIKILGGGMLACCGMPLWAQSPYVSKVIEFKPAPGQFMNELPEYEEGDTEEDIRRKAEDYLAYNARGMVSLGGFGGYIVLGFDHTIANVIGEYDFKVLGNAFFASDEPDASGRYGGSSEPGVIMVSYDVNGNGLADDPWYEIAGSEYEKPGTVKNYEITYFRPDPDTPPVTDPANPHILDAEHIRWTDNQGNEGFMPKIVFHRQDYYPAWENGDRITFKGTKLADNGEDVYGNGELYVLYAYDFGYADNHPNGSDLANIKIDWAVDENGDPANLPGVDFVRIHSGVNQFNGSIGECSTDVMGVEDLHPEISTAITAPTTLNTTVYPNPFRSTLTIETSRSGAATIIALTGETVFEGWLNSGTNNIDLSHLSVGIYMIQTDNQVRKVIKY